MFSPARIVADVAMAQRAQRQLLTAAHLIPCWRRGAAQQAQRLSACSPPPLQAQRTGDVQAIIVEDEGGVDASELVVVRCRGGA